MSWCFVSCKVIRGLILDKQKGNLVKADRFGQIKRAMHGTKMLSSHAIRSGLELLKSTLLRCTLWIYYKLALEYLSIGGQLYFLFILTKESTALQLFSSFGCRS